jgi:hypothetical protein
LKNVLEEILVFGVQIFYHGTKIEMEFYGNRFISFFQETKKPPIEVAFIRISMLGITLLYNMLFYHLHIC